MTLILHSIDIHELFLLFQMKHFLDLVQNIIRITDISLHDPARLKTALFMFDQEKHLLDLGRHALGYIQEMLHLKKEKKLMNIDGMKYQRHIEGEPELSSLMTQYARNLSRLYVLVLRRVR